MSESDMDTTPYCAIADVKDRLLIKTADSSYDTAMTNAIIEASRTIDIFLKPYTDVPLQYTVPDPVIIIAADLAASIFKRRLVPSEVKIRGAMQPDMINDIDGTGWFALAFKKLLDYIKNYYALVEQPDASDVVYNPDVFKELFIKGILTLKEARAYMGNAAATIKNILDEVVTRTETRTLTDTKALVKGETNTLTETDTITKTLETSDTQTKDITATLEDTKTLTKDETNTLNQTDTIVKDITTTETPTITKVSTLTDSQTKTLSDTKTIGETLTKTQHDSLTKGETLTKTQTDEITVKAYPTKKQKSFGFIKGKSSADNVQAGYEKEND